MKILIDGYNLIFQCGLQGRTVGSQALERARGRLISELTSRLNEESRFSITIVFDAKNRPIKNVADEEQCNGIRVVYAIDYEDADSLIEVLIKKHSSPKQLLVVSSDHRIQDAARRRKATPIDSDVWFDRIDRQATECDNQHESSEQKPELGNYNPFPPGYGEDF